MKKIRYIGQKAIKIDNVTNSGTIWNGAGDVQEVPDKIVPALLKHPDVWELADGGPRFLVMVGLGDKAQPYNLDVMNDAELKTLVSMHSIPGVDRKRRGDELRSQIAMALEPKA